jgi:hypothetical protein
MHIYPVNESTELQNELNDSTKFHLHQTSNKIGLAPPLAEFPHNIRSQATLRIQRRATKFCMSLPFTCEIQGVHGP